MAEAADPLPAAMSFALAGQAGAGKSTLGGLLLRHFGDAEAAGAGPPRAALDMPEELTRGATVDHKVRELRTPRRALELVDLPGRSEFMKNTTTGMLLADAVVLVVDASDFDAQTDLAHETFENVAVARTRGIARLVVACNKMDQVAFDEGRFAAVAKALTALLRRVGYDAASVPLIPTAVLSGENLFARSAAMPWYEGPTLWEAIDALEPPARDVDAPLRIAVLKTMKITGVGTVAMGRVLTGRVREQDRVRIAPRGLDCVLRSIQINRQYVPEARAGDVVGVVLQNVTVKDVARGDVLCDLDRPAAPIDRFVAKVTLLRCQNQHFAGYTPVLDVHAASVPCKWLELHSASDDGRTAHLEPLRMVQPGETCTVTMMPVMRLALETFERCRQLGSFTLRDNGKVIAIGKVLTIQELYAPVRSVVSQATTKSAAKQS